MFYMKIGRRSIAQMRKTHDDLILTLNKTDGSTSTVRRIIQGDKILDLADENTVEATL